MISNSIFNKFTRFVKPFLPLTHIFKRNKHHQLLADFYYLKYRIENKLGWLNVKKNKGVSPKNIPIKKIVRSIENSYAIKIEKDFIPMVSDSLGAIWQFEWGSAKWIAKMFPWRAKPLHRADDEVRLYKYLRDRGVRVPEILPNKDNNELAIIKFNGHIYPLIIMKYEILKEASHQHITEGEAQSIGRAIADMHIILKGYPHSKDPEYSNIHDLNGKVDSLDIEFLASKYAEALTPEVTVKLRTIRTQLQEFCRQFRIPDNLTNKSVIHGDLHLKQTVFLPNGDVYIYDFDDRFFGAVVWDLAICFVHLYTGGKISFERWETLCSWYLCGYESKMALKKEDLDALRLIMIHRLALEIRHYYCLAMEKQQSHYIIEIVPRYKLARYLLDKEEIYSPAFFLNRVHKGD